jgi:hypothetical protein
LENGFQLFHLLKALLLLFQIGVSYHDRNRSNFSRIHFERNMFDAGFVIHPVNLLAFRGKNRLHIPAGGCPEFLPYLRRLLPGIHAAKLAE